MNRREFVGALAMGALPASRIPAADASQDAAAPNVPDAGRAQRRIIWNNDGDDLRMNDCHSSGRQWQGPVWWEPFRLRNRHLLQSTISAEAWEKDYLPWIRGESTVYPLQAVLDRRGGSNRDVQSWAAFDYARAEVREYFAGLVREACERYDVDGIDLDWLRMPFFFRFGEERRNVPLMNDFVRRVADIVRAAGRRRGRPIVLAMRVPDSPERAGPVRPGGAPGCVSPGVGERRPRALFLQPLHPVGIRNDCRCRGSGALEDTDQDVRDGYEFRLVAKRHGVFRSFAPQFSRPCERDLHRT